MLAINTTPPTTSLSPPPHVHVHRYLLPLPLTSTTMASPLPSPRSPSLHHAGGHASSFRSSPPLVEEDASVFCSSPQGDASPFCSSPPLVEEDVSVFRSSPRRVEVDASVFPISPARAPEDASAPCYEENTAPPAEPPSLEELWKEMDVALWEALPLAERAKIEAEKKAEEEKRTARHAAWQAYVASERVRQLALWQKARARAVRVAEDARADALSAVGPKHFIYPWRRITTPVRSRSLAGKPPISTSQVARLRKRHCVGALGNGRSPGHSWRAASAPASVVAFSRSII